MPICILACITIVYIYPRRNINHLFRKSVKRYSAHFTLFLSARERAMDLISHNSLENNRRLHSEDCLFAQHLLDKSTSAKFGRRKFYPFYVVISIKLHNFAFVTISLAERSSLSHNIFSFFLLTDQSESSVGNASAPHSYRLQAVCDFLWRTPSADTSLSERNISLPQSYEKYEIRQRNPVKNKIIPVISIRNVEQLIEFVGLIQRLSGCRTLIINAYYFAISLGKRSCIYISQSVKCYFGDLAVVYFFNYCYQNTDSFRLE